MHTEKVKKLQGLENIEAALAARLEIVAETAMSQELKITSIMSDSYALKMKVMSGISALKTLKTHISELMVKRDELRVKIEKVRRSRQELEAMAAAERDRLKIYM